MAAQPEITVPVRVILNVAPARRQVRRLLKASRETLAALARLDAELGSLEDELTAYGIALEREETQ
jgi:hypothetical protein